MKHLRVVVVHGSFTASAGRTDRCAATTSTDTEPGEFGAQTQKATGTLIQLAFLQASPSSPRVIWLNSWFMGLV